MSLANFSAADDFLNKPQGALRIATVNVSLYRNQAGQLTTELEAGDNEQAKRIAGILQIVRPDIVLINEIDYQDDDAALLSFLKKYLASGQTANDGKKLEPLDYPYYFTGPVNTGVDSGMDLNADGKLGSPEDAWGYGRYPGQYAMAVLSRFPIERDAVRTFQKFLWSSLPGAKEPIDPQTNKPYYPKKVWKRLRLSSKSHWDVPIEVDGRVIHVLASHPTPPAFDGAEDRNGCRNHDEIRFWQHYISPESEDTRWLVDDAGKQGPLANDASFFIAGDLNADPVDGSGIAAGIRGLLALPRVIDPQPKSAGAVTSSRKAGHANETHRGDPALDTSQFTPRSVGNLRVDYCLPSADMKVLQSGVFWPQSDELGGDWVEATDHRLVWVDVQLLAD